MREHQSPHPNRRAVSNLRPSPHKDMAEGPTKRGAMCVYEIDGDDRIVYCNDEWDLFAMANGGADIVSANVKATILWDHFADASTVDLYRRLVTQVREGRSVTLHFRCDSPELLRLLEMKISPLANEHVRFSTREKRVERRDAFAFPLIEETESPIIVCSWCGLVNIYNKIWQDVEIAVNKLKLFERRISVSHGICPDCYANLSNVLKEPSYQMS